MLENVRAQLFLVLLSIVGAIACIATLPPLYGPDLKGGTQLIYDVPEEVLRELTKKEQVSINDIMEQTVLVLRERIDPTGTTNATVVRSGDTGILIELPWSEDPQELIRFKDRIANLGKLEMRIVADDDYSAAATEDAPEIKFNLQAERTRLESWLKQPGNKELLTTKVEDITDNLRRYNEAGPAVGPLAFPNLAWYPRVIGRNDKDATRWDTSYAKMQSPALSRSTVQVFDDTEWNNGVIPEAMEKAAADATPKREPFLVELIAVNMHEEHFTGDDLDPTGVSATTDQQGGMAVAYSISGAKSLKYADWSEEYLNKASAIILNGIVKSAPVFESRIPGRGRITGDFTRAEVEELVKVLRTGSLRIEPEFVSQNQIGANLGSDAIASGLYSLLAGGLLVFLFVLWYYKRPGVIACITLLLNMLLLYASMLFMQATITLPGLGGIVLTLGMAVDANVLIYERIREELEKGKDMVRAVRAGFERAMSAILDSNITTFLVGVVLFNVGVGPVRGFAVTLMAGIVMTIFTQFFVTRLLFHFALQRKLLDGYRPRTMLGTTKFNFVGHIGKCIAVSSIAIVAGLTFALTSVPREVMLGIDFTGGGNLHMVVAEPMTADQVRAKIAADAEFNTSFPNSFVNTVGERDAQDRCNEFAVRLKLNDTQREEITAGRRAWRELRAKNEADGLPPPDAYQPPYLLALKRVFADDLVKPAFSDPDAIEDPEQANLLYAQIELHFQSAVDMQAARAKLAEAKLLNGSIDPIPDRSATAGKDVLVQWKVPANTRKWELFDIASKALADLKTVDGQNVILSNPFPQAQEIQGRLVDDLRNAAISALIISWALVIFYLRIRFHEYKYGFAAVVALIHDVLITFGAVVAANYFGLVHAEISVNMIAAFLTIIGYSVNDTIVVFDRIRENLRENARQGITEPTSPVVNRSLNQTLSRTIITTGLTMFVVLAQFVVNWGSESDLESFAFAMIVGMITGTYSTIYIAAPILIWMRQEEIHIEPEPTDETDSDVEALAETPAQ
ncbi:MAG: protein translocase subunit SecD [Planctomycetes bacterium]|nr:protein translocase subunit SecD [Planctomycetota bacterium]